MSKPAPTPTPPAPDPSWDLFRTFLAVCREGSLSGAARALGLTQPTVARHVDALESALASELFLRTPRGLSPTELALTLTPYAESLSSIAAALLRAASARGTAIAGTVRITASEIIGGEVLPPILATLRATHPALTLELVLSNAVSDLLQRDADVAVRMVDPAQSQLVARRVGQLTVGLFAHRRYLEQHPAPKTLADLAAHALIGFDRETPALRALTARIPELSRARFALRADSDLAQLAVLRAGFGVGACQLAIARRDPELVRVLPRAFAFTLPVWVVMHEDLRSTPRCRAVFDALVAGLSRHVDRARPAA